MVPLLFTHEWSGGWANQAAKIQDKMNIISAALLSDHPFTPANTNKQLIGELGF